MNPSYHFYASLAIFLVGFATASWTITLRFLHFYQQEEYDNIRFLRWWIHSGSFEKRAVSVSLIFAMAVWLSEKHAGITTLPLWRVLLLSTVLAFTIAAVGRSNRSDSAKKALVMTTRAKRIFYLGLLIQVLIFAAASLILQWTPYSAFYMLATLVIGAFILTAIPITLIGANLLLAPIESSVQKRYLREAQTILDRVKPEIVGITGSYGKTSFKHILSHILSSHASTLTTPGSVNTLMGITRIIRERLRNDHAYFIVEMGAYGIGSIRRLCELTPPNNAVVTAIGLAHMERFKSIDAVQQAKSELPQAVPKEGFTVLNGDDPNLRKMAEGLQCKVLFYGTHSESGPLDCRLAKAENTEIGVQCTVEYEGKSYNFEMPLHGEHQAQNAAGAFLTAMQLGVAPFTAIAALQSAPPIAHRLVVQRNPNGTTTVDDAYNSNPTGFRCALEVLKKLRGSRKILITPGMVELGDEADQTHREIAAYAAEACDVILLVASHRLQALRAGLLERGFAEENLYEFDALHEAQAWLNQNTKQGDVVLYENDLPDLYETQTVFRLF